MKKQAYIRPDIFIEISGGMTLLANQCEGCGMVYFPKVRFCGQCFEDRLKDMPLSRRGTLYTYTITHMPSAHFEPPFATGYVDTAEGARIFASLEINEKKPFKVGMEMDLIIGPLWVEDDKEIIAYRYRPV